MDGEVVAFAGKQTGFARLQQRMQLRDPEAARRTGVAVYYYLFDLLHLDGYDVTGLELRHRKALLRRALRFRGPLRFNAHRTEEGEAFYREACSSGWEGVIAKHPRFFESQELIQREAGAGSRRDTSIRCLDRPRRRHLVKGAP